jgi:hypothetical protein
VLEVAADPELLGGQTDVLAVLHTWGQNVQFHPHAHCVVPGGRLSLEGTHWVHSRPNFFLPVRVLSRVFRGKFPVALRAALDAGQLRCQPDTFEWALAAAVADDWVVYAKPPFEGPEAVLKYLARYTHRVAISKNALSSSKVVEGDLQDVIGLVIGEMHLEKMEVVDDVIHQARRPRYREHGTDAASGHTLDAIGGFVMDVGSSLDRNVGLGLGRLSESPQNSPLPLLQEPLVTFLIPLAVAFPHYVGESGSHSKPSDGWSSEDVFQSPLFQNPRRFSRFF